MQNPSFDNSGRRGHLVTIIIVAVWKVWAGWQQQIVSFLGQPSECGLDTLPSCKASCLTLSPSKEIGELPNFL